MADTSTNAGAGATDGDGSRSATVDYDDMLATLDVAIDEARRKVESGRVYDPENEKVRIKWVKALAYTMNVRRQVANDAAIDELAERIEALEDAREGNGDLVGAGVGAD